MQTSANNSGLAAIFGTNPYSIGSIVAANAQKQPTPSVHDVVGAVPYSSQPGPTANAGTPTGAGGGGATYTGPVVDPNVVAQYDQGINNAQSALNRLPTQLQIAKSNISKLYSQNQNELASAKDKAQGSWTSGKNENSQNFRTDKNNIADKSSAGLLGLLRMLGAMGAGGSSDARFVAPQAVAGEASIERSGAGQTFAKNASTLDTNWNNFMIDDANSHKKLDDWNADQNNQAESQSQSARSDLLTKLADLVGKKAQYRGGSYAGAAQPYVDQANAAASLVDQLARINPTYNGVTPVYTAPSLSNYIPNDASAPTVANNATESQYTPYLSLLLGGRDKTKAVA